MGKTKRDQLLGKLDLLVLRILASGESMHGCAIAERIEELSEKVLQVGEGALYPRFTAWMKQVGFDRNGPRRITTGARVTTG